MPNLRPLLALLAVLSTTALATPAAGSTAPETRVVGGEEAQITDWPWQIALARPPSEGGDGYDRQICGGSLLAPTLVLTAAHCVYDEGFQPPSDFSVIAGRTTLSNSDQGAEIAVADLFYFVSTSAGPAAQSQTQPPAGPPLYDPETSEEWDAVLLELASAAPAPAAPIQIAGPGERDLWDPGDPAYITGWGSTATAAGPYPDDLQEAEVEIVSDSDCASAYGSSFFAATMVCAGVYPTGGTDTCQGDSGGPLVVAAGADGYRLVGDTSFGTGCALPLFPGVYGRVADDPMRTALAEAALSITGIDIVGDGTPQAGGGDGAAPNTTLSKRPRKRTRKRRATFAFSANETATFECAFNSGAFAPCTSPVSKRVKRKRHTFFVRATDAAGNREAEPVSYSWKVKKRKRGSR